jgi:hypothetical protein
MPRAVAARALRSAGIQEFAVIQAGQGLDLTGTPSRLRIWIIHDRGGETVAVGKIGRNFALHAHIHAAQFHSS